MQRSIHDEFVEKLKAFAARMVPDDPLNPKTVGGGAIASREHLEIILNHVEIAKNNALNIETGREFISDISCSAQNEKISD